MSARNIVKSIQDIMRQDSGVDGDAQRLSQLSWMLFLKIIDDQDRKLESLRPRYRSPVPDKFKWRNWAENKNTVTGEELISFVNLELLPGLKNLPITGKSLRRKEVVESVLSDVHNYMKSGSLMRQVINKISGINLGELSERKHFGEIYEQLLNDLQAAGNSGEFYTPRAVTAFMVGRIAPRLGEIILDPSCGTGGFLTCAIKSVREAHVKNHEDEELLMKSLRAVELKQLPHMLCTTNMLLHGVEDPSFVTHGNSLSRELESYTSSSKVDVILSNPPFGGRIEDGIENNFPSLLRSKETADLFMILILKLLKTNGRAAVVLPDGFLAGEGNKSRIKEKLLSTCNLHTIVRLPNSVFRPYASIGTNILFFENGKKTEDVWFYEHRVPAGKKSILYDQAYKA